jgi:hypothetical protein
MEIIDNISKSFNFFQNFINFFQKIENNIKKIKKK